MTISKDNSGKFILVQCLLFIVVISGISACNLIPKKEKGDTQVSAEPLPDTAKNVAKSPGQIWLHKIESTSNKEWQKHYCQKNYKSYTIKFSKPVLAENDVVKGEYEEIKVDDDGAVYSTKFVYETVSESELKFTSVIGTDNNGKQTDNTNHYNKDGKPTHLILDILDDGNMLVIGGAYNIFVTK